MPIQTANDLIIKSFQLINEYSPNELPADYEILDGLDYLNDLLDYLSGKEIFIPYTYDLSFNLIAGQSDYRFSQQIPYDVQSNKIMQIFDIVLHFGEVDFPLNTIQHDEAFQLVRYPTARTRPTQVFMQNDNAGTNLKFFYTPDSNYSITLRAKFVLDIAALQTNITSVPRYYLRYLRYALARELSSVYENSAWDQKLETEYQKMDDDIKANVDTDWSLNISGVLARRWTGWTKGSIVSG